MKYPKRLRRAYRKRPARRTRKPVKKTTVKKIVKRELSKQIETKECFSASSITPATISISTSSVAGNMFICSPNSASSTIGYLSIPQGDGNGQRVGNRIRTKSLYMKYILTQTAQNAVTNPTPTPLEVLIYFFKVKTTPQDPPSVGNLRGASANFFEYGNSSVGFDGSLYDVLHKINPDRFTYLAHRRHKLGYQGNNVNNNPSYANSHNNDFKMNIVSGINLTKFCPKEILYDDLTSSTTTSPYIFCLVQPVNATGVINSTSVLPMTMQFELQYKYSDA